MKNCVAVAAVLAIAAGASASFTNMEMHQDTWSFPLSPGNDTLSFPRFDTMGGLRVLKGVQLDVDGTMQADITAENNSAIPVNNFGVSITGIVDVSVSLLLAGLGIVANSPIVPVGASDNGGIPNGMGPDFHDFGTVSGADTDSAFLPAFPAVVAAFTGVGFVNGTVTGSGGFAAQGTADATINFDNFGTEGRAKLIYWYDVIPTPGSLALMGFAGAAAIRRRRA